MTEAEKDAIILADAIRHLNREQAYGTDSRAGLASYAEDRKALKGIGAVLSIPKPRYHERWHGTPTTTLDKAERSGVECLYADGTREVRTQSSFRQGTQNRHTNTAKAQTEHKHRIMASDLPAAI